MGRSSAKLDTEDWESGVGYNRGRVVRSLSNNHKYVRIVAGAGTTDPALDYTNWKPEDPRVPRRITTLTTGTGTYVPLADNALCEVTLQGGGSSGARVSSSTVAGGGAAGAAIVQIPIRIPIAGLGYSVGVGGLGSTSSSGNAGSATKFGGLVAEGGEAPSGANGGFGGQVAIHLTDSDGVGNAYGVAGGGGGQGGGSGSSAAAFRRPNKGNGKATSGIGHGPGGHSVFAKGGNGASIPGSSGVAGEKGSGGGGTDSPGTSGPGGDGFIIVVEY